MDKNRRGRHQRLSRYLISSLLLGIVIVPCVLLQSCDGDLSHSTLRDIEWERSDWERDSRALDRIAKLVQTEIAASPKLFEGTSAPEEWRAELTEAKHRLAQSESDDRRLSEIASLNRASSQAEALRLLNEARDARERAASEAKTVEASVSKWRDFSTHPQAAVSAMNESLHAIETVDLRPLSATVETAERDWPSKKADLEGRLSTLKDVEKTAQARWDGAEPLRAEASGRAPSGSTLAALISLDDNLAHARTSLVSGSKELTDLSGQLYISWDKILADLEISHFGRENIYRERIKTIRTRLLDPSVNRSEVTDDDRWISVPEATYRSVENDIGMTLAHKDAGLYDSEAHESPQPPGFAYLAPIETGSNRYGYWTHSGGQTFWSFLPQYLVLRELLRSHDYRPIYANEYRGYTTARAAGRTYYGGVVDSTTRSRTPTYGTHGSFTAKNYATSRYVQSGGFRGSAYASNRTGGVFSGFRSSRPDSPHLSVAPGSSSIGKRFGSGAAPSSGRRFGKSGGPGRSFGRRR